MNFTLESLCAQWLLYPLRYFNDIWYTYSSGQDGVSYAIMIALSCFLFEVSPLYELYLGKLVR